MAAGGHGRKGCESGYAYVMALFMVLTVIIGSQIVLRNMVTVARSEREAEMIWRGDQYVRAIKMYYRKTGHFPGSPEDLVKGVVNVHFLRSEAMIDPMNNQDGAWRFIYTNGSGAIIGSVKYGSLQQMALMDLNGGQMPGAQGSTANPNSQNGPNGPGITGMGRTGMPGPMGGNPANGAAGSAMGAGLASGMGTNGQGSSFGQGLNGAIAGPQPTGPVTGQVFGGQVIGVGSTVDRVSVRVYKGGTKYNEWEFIWNPIEEQARAIQQGIGAAGAPGGIPGLGGLPIAPIGGAAGGAAGNAGGAMGTSGNSSSGTNGTATNDGTANPNGSAAGPDGSIPSGSTNNPPPPTQ